MKKYLFAPLFAAAGFLLAASAGPVEALDFPESPTWTTMLTRGEVIVGTPIGDVTVGNMEGLTGDDNGNFYVADRGLDDGGADPTNSDECHVWKINSNNGEVDLVGRIDLVPCRPSGLAFGPDGALYITTSVGVGTIYRLTPSIAAPFAEEYATGVPGANGVAFSGNLLYVTDGTKNKGRVWQISGSGAQCNIDDAALINCVEIFRTQPQRNSIALGGFVDTPDGVGSARHTVPRYTSACSAEIDEDVAVLVGCKQDKQDIVANGIAFTPSGNKAYVSDTARGAIWVAKLKNNGHLIPGQQNCDKTFNTNVLCMASLYIAHPLLEGADGIALLNDGTIIVSSNERNAIVAILPNKKVVDVFQNGFTGDFLRNGDDTNLKPLEAPSSPFISGKTFCTTNADFPRRDGTPNSAGVGAKVICLDQDIEPGGLSLPR